MCSGTVARAAGCSFASDPLSHNCTYVYATTGCVHQDFVTQPMLVKFLQPRGRVTSSAQESPPTSMMFVAMLQAYPPGRYFRSSVLSPSRTVNHRHACLLAYTQCSCPPKMAQCFPLTTCSSALRWCCVLSGFERITNADSSRVVIDQMIDVYQAYPMECEF